MKTNGNQVDRRSRELDLLLGLALRASVFLSADGVPYALIPGNTGEQSDLALLQSREFATFLRAEYHAENGDYPKEALLRVVRDLVDRRVSHQTGSSPPIALRVARGQAEHARESGQPQVFRHVLALDLGRRSPAGPDSVLEIDADGWSVNHSSGFAFFRPRVHCPLPLPERAGPQALSELKHLLRVEDPDWMRVLTWLLAAMRSKGPYPILVLQGEAGSGKSQAAKMLRSLLDPSAVPFQPLPTNPNTLLRLATQTWIQAFDHITGMPKQISTALCRLSTSAGFHLATDPSGSPITHSLARPILMTVPISASGAAWQPRGDLLDRMLTVTLPPLTPETTRPESEIAERFRKARPKILGALAQAVSVAMGRVDQVHLTRYPRNAEAAVWAIAAAPALNIPEESLQEALQQQSEFAHPRDPLVEKIVTLMATRDDWQGSATKLQLELDLSTAPNHLSRQLKEAQTRLNEEGIEIVFPPRQQIGQLIRLSKLHAITEGPVIMPPKIDHQIVISQENQAETMTLSAQTDRHTDTPAADTAASTEFSAGAVAGEMEPGARTIQAASSPSAVTARSTVTEPDPGFCGRQPGG